MAGKTERRAAAARFCVHYEYDDEMGCYICEMNLDEDEMVLFLQHRFEACPYFSFSTMTISWQAASK